MDGGKTLLRALGGPERGERWELESSRAHTIGRSRKSDIQLDDPTVSGSHARLECHSGTWFIVDLGSTHGTRVNKQRILTTKPVFDRDTIWLGKSLLQLRQYCELPPEDLAEIERGIELAEKSDTDTDI